MSRHTLRTLPERPHDLRGIASLASIAVTMAFARADMLAHVTGSHIPAILDVVIALCVMVSLELAFDGPVAHRLVNGWLRR